MAKKRYINTKFWSDNFVIELEPLERYLFLYLLTNEHTDICGVYELPLKIIERETGIDYNSLLKILERLKGKIFFIDGWVYIKNFSKHQALNPKIEEGIARSLKDVPEHILSKIKQIDIDYNRLYIEPQLLILKLKPKLKPYKEPAEDSGKQSLQDPINQVLDSFYKINPTLNWGNKTQRKAAEDLVKRFTLEKTLAMIDWYKTQTSDPYCPVATNPLAFKNKLADIKIFADKKKANPLITTIL